MPKHLGLRVQLKTGALSETESSGICIIEREFFISMNFFLFRLFLEHIFEVRHLAGYLIRQDVCLRFKNFYFIDLKIIRSVYVARFAIYIITSFVIKFVNNTRPMLFRVSNSFSFLFSLDLFLILINTLLSKYAIPYYDIPYIKKVMQNSAMLLEQTVILSL